MHTPAAEVNVIRIGICFVGLLTIAVSLARVSASRPQTGTDEKIPDEDYGIYSTLITQKYVKPDTKMLLIEDITFRYDFSEGNEKPWRDKPPKGITIDQSAAEDFEAKNRKHWVLAKSSFKLPVKFDLISDADLRSVFHGKLGDLEWTDFYRRYPASSGFIMLSRVGFNTEHTQALVYVGSRCGPDCGDLFFSLMEKTGESWTVKKELKKRSWG